MSFTAVLLSLALSLPFPGGGSSPLCGGEETAASAGPDTPADGGYAFRRTTFAMRSNLLLPLMNLGLEIPLGRVVSLEADVACPWLSENVTGGLASLEAYHVSGGFRFWFTPKGKDRLLGHSVGITGGASDFDLGFNADLLKGRGYHMKGIQGTSAECCIDWTYAFPLGKDGFWRIEVGIGGGAVYHKDVRYDQYGRKEALLRDPRLIETRGWYFGPTRVHVNIVLPFK